MRNICTEKLFAQIKTPSRMETHFHHIKKQKTETKTKSCFGKPQLWDEKENNLNVLIILTKYNFTWHNYDILSHNFEINIQNNDVKILTASRNYEEKRQKLTIS